MTDMEHGFTCYWRIENFYIEENCRDCTLHSQVFDVSMFRDSTWHLELQHLCSTPLGLYLHKDGLANNSNIDLTMSVLMTNGWIQFINDHCKGINPKVSGQGGTFIKWKEHIPVKKYLINGCLTVSCHMSNGTTKNRYEQCVLTSRMISNYRIIHKSLQKFVRLKPNDLLNFPESNTLDMLKFQDSRTTLPFFSELASSRFFNTKSTQTENAEDVNVFNDLEDILRLFKEKKFRYVTLRTDSKDFVVHKALLCARSPVFNAMFQGNMMENENNIVDINDLNDDTLSLLVQFLHLEPIGFLDWEDAVRLYYAADKYQIELLKNECRSLLKIGLSVENICEILIFADTHHDKELQQSALEYFCKNSKIILRSNEWKDLLYNRPDLATEILHKLAENL